MTPYNEIDIMNAFNQQTDSKSWQARAAVTGGTPLVHFTNGGMVAFVYNLNDMTFQVKFNKFQGAWGDYMRAIARGMYVILNTLKSAGLPFDGPTTLNGMKLECSTGADLSVFVSWPSPVNPIMPELRGLPAIDAALNNPATWALPSDEFAIGDTTEESAQEPTENILPNL